MEFNLQKTFKGLVFCSVDLHFGTCNRHICIYFPDLDTERDAVIACRSTRKHLFCIIWIRGVVVLVLQKCISVFVMSFNLTSFPTDFISRYWKSTRNMTSNRVILYFNLLKHYCSSREMVTEENTQMLFDVYHHHKTLTVDFD